MYDVLCMIPLLVARLIARGGDMGNIIDLCVKEFENKLKSDEGTQVGTTGDLATLTAAGGKRMYLASAKCVFIMNTTNAAGQDLAVELKVNGVTKEIGRATLSFNSGTESGLSSFEYEFKNIGHSVTAAQIIKLEVTTADTQITINGMIECFEEDPLTSPQIPAI